MEWFRSYTDLLCNIFLFLSLDLFLNSFAACKKRNFQIPIRIIFVLIWGIISLIPHVPYFLLLSALLNLSYVFLLVESSILNRIIVYVKYEIYYFLGSVIIAIAHSLITWDVTIFETNKVYAIYASIIGNSLLYIILSMYIIFRKLSDFPSGRIYKRYFLAITGGIVFLLILCSMILDSNIIKQEDVVPLIFSLLLIVTLLCISVYRKVISVLDENTHNKIEAEKNSIQKDYYTHVEANLKKLSILRHDFKNHLIIIQGYADQGDNEKLKKYIQSLHEELTPTDLINTPSQLISSILNAKNEECRRQNISFHFEQAFSKVSIEDFDIVTILSNLLDNAITAAAKCESGSIYLKILQTGTYLDIDCVNDHAEQIKEERNVFHTTKTEQKEIHGLGITSMRKTVEKLRGKINIDYTDNSFHVNILLPNY